MVGVEKGKGREGCLGTSILKQCIIMRSFTVFSPGLRCWGRQERKLVPGSFKWQVLRKEGTGLARLGTSILKHRLV